jgi:hypothetical protein
MNDNPRNKQNDEIQDSEMQQLRRLVVTAPPTAFNRFRRRAGIMQGSRLLIESQVTGFWLVLDAILKRLFRAVSRDPANPAANRTQSPTISGDKA